MYKQNTGAYVADREKSNEEISKELGYRESKENDRIDLKYGFDRVKDSKERTGYLMNMHSVSNLYKL